MSKTAEEQAKEYFKTIMGFDINTDTIYQNKKGSCQIYLLNVLTDFADEYTSQQLAEKEKRIKELEEGIMKRVDVLTEQGNIPELKVFYDSIKSLLTPKEAPDEQNDNHLSKNYSEQLGGEITGDDLEVAKGLVLNAQQCSTSFLQRKLKIGYNRASRIIEILERDGVIGPYDVTTNHREVLIKK